MKPIVIQVYSRTKDQDFKHPLPEVVVYGDAERNNILLHYNNSHNYIRERKPKLKELTRYNWFEKLSYLLPFKTEVSDIIVDAVKLLIGGAIGYVLG